MSKHLLPVGDKPMIYYPLSTLLLSNVRDILLICNARDQSAFRNCWAMGANLGYQNTRFKMKPMGWRKPLQLVHRLYHIQRCVWRLRTIFFGPTLSEKLQKASEFSAGASIIACRVRIQSDLGSCS